MTRPHKMPAAAVRPATEPARAYSYLRFSTPEQQKGDSFRRQTQLAADYCAEHGLILDTELTLRDLGVSAFHGKNAEEGSALGVFLQQCEGEPRTVPPGSLLLVESLDRVSREKPRRAMRLLERICDAGVAVVTLSDKKKYTAETLDDDTGMELILSLLVMARAHNESLEKAKRLKQAWHGKRLAMDKDGKPLTALGPAWLKLNKDTGEWEHIPERVAVVKRIFRDTLAGKGQHAIAQALQQEGVEPWGKVKARNAQGAVRERPIWNRSYIAKILRNPAVLGTFIPGRMERKDGRSVRQLLAPVKGYFGKPVVSLSDWKRVRDMERKGRRAGTGAKAAEVRNLFGGLMRCACGATATVIWKGAGNHRYFGCTDRLAKVQGCKCPANLARYDNVERTFLSEASAGTLLLTAPANGTDALTRELEQTEAKLLGLSDALENLAEQARMQPSRTIADQIAAVEAEQAELQATHADLAARLDASGQRTVKARLKELRAEVDRADKMDRAKANALLRQVFACVRLEADRLVFVWKSEAETAIALQDWR